MNVATAVSKNGVLIRLTDERWLHITTSHEEIGPKSVSNIMSVIKTPDAILKGDTNELLAVKKNARKSVWIVVAYKEVSKNDGFVLTAYITTSSRWLFQREIIWSRES